MKSKEDFYGTELCEYCPLKGRKCSEFDCDTYSEEAYDMYLGGNEDASEGV